MAHSVSLSWTASPDAASNITLAYNVYRGSGAGQETVKINTSPVTGTTFVDTNPPLGEDFYIAKSVLNGVESIASNEATAVILPQPPTALTVTSSN